MDLIFFGIQGCGKGTQAKKLASERGYYIFEAGGELRTIAASGSELGNTVQSYIDEGHLVPHEIIMEVVKAAILAQPEDQEILFDGIPRDEDQKRDFDTVIQEVGRDVTCVHFLLDREEAVSRIKSRASIECRADDADQEKVNRRMDLFIQKTMPVIHAYNEASKVVEVDASGGVDEVYEILKEAII